MLMTGAGSMIIVSSFSISESRYQPSALLLYVSSSEVELNRLPTILFN